MRLIRLGALIGSVVLLVATSVSMFEQRAQQRRQQDARVTATVLVADQSVESVVVRAVALVELADEGTDPSELVRSFPAGVSGCVAIGEERRCTDVDLFALGAFGSALSTSVQRREPALVVDETTGALLVVARDPVAGDAVTVALRLPVAALIDGRAATSIAEFGADIDISLSATPAGDVGRVGPVTADGRRVVTDTIGLAGDGGSVRVVASTIDDAGLVGDDFALSVVLLALGTVLMALAAWTFLLDRRALERRATTDELTALVNRREFERVAEEALLAAERSGAGACVMLIDLNGFKQINDTLGHQIGDQVLKAAAQRLTSAVRDTDVVARWGGDEFVILLPGIEDGTGVRGAAERIASSLAATPVVRGVTVTGAIGAALFPRHGSGLDELLSAADIAMYSAKSSGVAHRLADAHTVELAAEEFRTGAGYLGPDRRRQPGRADAVSRD